MYEALLCEKFANFLSIFPFNYVQNYYIRWLNSIGTWFVLLFSPFRSTYERVIPIWLVCWARRVGTIDFCPALAALVSPEQNCYPYHTLFHFISPHRPAKWAGSRAGSPVSVLLVSLSQSSCVSPVGLTDGRGGRGWVRSQIIRRRESLWSSLNRMYS